jgi:hypothetical protein
LPPHDEGTLIFCTHCGAPQVLLSEDLLTQVETLGKAATDADAIPAPRDPRSLVWAGAIRCAALAGAIAAGLACISTLLPGVVLLTVLWAVISPVVVIGLFQARFPLTAITTGFGARLGLLTGLFIAVVMSTVNTVELLVRRFAMHGRGMVEFDQQWNDLFAKQKDVLMTQLGSSATPFAQALGLPEFRAGFLLAGMAMACAILLVITTAGGAFAGFARSRSRI